MKTRVAVLVLPVLFLAGPVSAGESVASVLAVCAADTDYRGRLGCYEGLMQTLLGPAKVLASCKQANEKPHPLCRSVYDDAKDFVACAKIEEDPERRTECFDKLAARETRRARFGSCTQTLIGRVRLDCYLEIAKKADVPEVIGVNECLTKKGDSALACWDALADRREPSPISLALSGGGYRAMLFHLGAMKRLHELKLLDELEEVSSVSGGSITAARLVYKWAEIVGSTARADAFERELQVPIYSLAGKTLDWPNVLLGALTPIKVSTLIQKRLAKHLFGDATLCELPTKPAFKINATNLQTGTRFVFSREWLGDPILGCLKTRHTPLAKAVAASAAFPPVLSPAVLRPPEGDWSYTAPCPVEWESDNRREGLEDRDGEPLKTMRKKIYLTDAGVYDNLGISTLWSPSKGNTRRILVSDGSGRLKRSPKKGWQLLRLKSILGNLPTDLRTESLIDRYDDLYEAGYNHGAFWSMRYEEWGEKAKKRARKLWPHKAAQAADQAAIRATKALASTRTALYGLKELRRQQIVNFGYLAAEVALQSYFYDDNSRCKVKPAILPYEKAGLETDEKGNGKPLNLHLLCGEFSPAGS